METTQQIQKKLGEIQRQSDLSWTFVEIVHFIQFQLVSEITPPPPPAKTKKKKKVENRFQRISYKIVKIQN